MKKKVYLYCRRSSEGEDKQMLSLPSQVKELRQFANKIGLIIIKTFEESMSAKAPGRPQFAEMMAGLANKEADGILCWKLDRLARNPVDGGAISWAMKDLKVEIITPSKTYSQLNEDSLLMSLEFGMAQKFIDDLGKNSQRGMKTKAEMGWYPAPASTGYKNTPDFKKGFKEIIKDEDRFELIKRAFKEIIKGKQACQVYKEVSENWKLTNRDGRIISRSAFYYLLNNPFYYGEYEWPKNSGNWFIGKHEPMITREEFDMVQKALGKFGKPITHSHNFDLTGLFSCQECGCAITASEKIKHYKKSGRIAIYTYYHCTKKNKKIKCHSKPLTEADILKQIDDLLMKLTPDQDFIDWSKKWLSIVHKDEASFKEETLKFQQTSLSNIERRLNKLLDMKLDENIDDQTYKEKKQILDKEKNEIKRKLDNTGNDLNDWRIKVENTIDFARACRDRFNNGTRENKQEILMAIGSNLIFKSDKLLDIKLEPEYGVLANKQNWSEQYKDWLEPHKYTEIMDKYDDLRPANPVWLPL